MSLSQLTSRSAFTRAEAAERIGLAGKRDAVPHLVDHLADRSAEVRMRVVEALGRLTAGKHEALIAALRDSDELVRLQAAESIGKSTNQRSLAALRGALTDDSELVRSYVAAAIGRVGTRADRVLLRKQVTRERSDAARLGLFEGLWQLGDRTALESAIELLDSDDYRVRCATARALGVTFGSPETRNKVRAALRERLKRERAAVVRDALRGSLRAARTKGRNR
jgi:HEAT repeat protein